MAIRRKYSADYLALSPLDAAAMAQAPLAHVALLREVRAHHKAIAIELQTFYDSVAAETIPDEFLDFLKDETEEASV
jgi:Anti-sigma factor NepR